SSRVRLTSRANACRWRMAAVVTSFRRGLGEWSYREIPSASSSSIAPSLAIVSPLAIDENVQRVAITAVEEAATGTFLHAERRSTIGCRSDVGVPHGRPHRRPRPSVERGLRAALGVAGACPRRDARLLYAQC